MPPLLALHARAQDVCQIEGAIWPPKKHTANRLCRNGGYVPSDFLCEIHRTSTYLSLGKDSLLHDNRYYKGVGGRKARWEVEWPRLWGPIVCLSLSRIRAERCLGASRPGPSCCKLQSLPQHRC